jgi:5-methylcytosine-specific restriction enzyme A
VYAEFVKKFGRYRGFQTSITDFEEGATYSAFTLAIYTRTYNNRAGGIRPVGEVGTHEAVVVNVTLAGGRYANEWLEDGRRLKCYLKAPVTREESHSEEALEANQSIMKYPHIPVLVFTRKSRDVNFVYNGMFQYVQIAADEKGKWFDLLKYHARTP